MSEANKKLNTSEGSEVGKESDKTEENDIGLLDKSTSVQTLDPGKLDRLERQIDGFMDHYWRKHIYYNRITKTLVVLGIILSLAVTAAGFQDWGKAAGFIGLGITFIVSLQTAFNFAEKSAFSRLVHVEAKILRDRLRYKVHSKADFEAVVEALQDLRRFAGEKMPEGELFSTLKETPYKSSSDVKKT